MISAKHFDAMKSFRLTAMAQHLVELIETRTIYSMGAEEVVVDLIECEQAARLNRKLEKLIRDAKFSYVHADVEDIYYLKERALRKEEIKRLAQCEWIDRHQNLIILAPSGAGKSYVAQALGMAACRQYRSVRYTTMQDLIEAHEVARFKEASERIKVREMFTKPDLLIIDDFLTTTITRAQQDDVFKILQKRDEHGSTMIVTQIEPVDWPSRMEDHLVSDQILSRLMRGERSVLSVTGVNMRQFLARED